MTTEELRSKTIEELNQELLDLRKEQFNLRMQSGVGQMTRVHQFKVNKRNIARVKTIMNERLAQSSIGGSDD
ncbi:MAG: 50S ribosomal protein L29 [Gammaproteobacteria bacterium]|nr:50S ribosomal protein L29 [Gammaproteobacteria bacterium]